MWKRLLGRLSRTRRYALARHLLDPGIERCASLREALDNLHRELEVFEKTAGSERAFETFRPGDGLKLHLGCGGDIRPGWINVDFLPGQITHPVDGGMFINHDLRGGLPLPAESSRLIYSSHFFEHLDHQTGLALMRECHRALEPGGIFRLALPNFRKLFEAYLREDAPYFELLAPSELIRGLDPELRTLADYVNYGVYQYGEHKVIYDVPKLRKLLTTMGFRDVQESGFRADLDLSDEVRKRYTFYVDAVK